MFNWLRELYEIRRENREARRHCESCEVLKVELSNLRREKERLLGHILEPKVENQAPVDHELPQPVLKHKPWRVKQQELEAEDRRQASRIMQEFKSRANQVSAAEKIMGVDNGEKADAI